ncbi:MAG: hypothetical protein IPN42_09665 [Methylococcaceae bacterium]|nr:hypothetical protein [Methylococcaceae bacterium]
MKSLWANFALLIFKLFAFNTALWAIVPEAIIIVCSGNVCNIAAKYALIGFGVGLFCDGRHSTALVLRQLISSKPSFNSWMRAYCYSQIHKAFNTAGCRIISRKRPTCWISAVLPSLKPTISKPGFYIPHGVTGRA